MEGNKDVIFKKHVNAVLFFSLAFALGCQTGQTKPDPKKAAYIHQVNDLEKRVRELAELNAVLKTKNKMSAKANIEKSLNVQSSPNEEHSLYAAALESYWMRDLQKLTRINSMLVKSFPKSTYADNALLLQANLLYSQGSFGEALQILNKITDQYPHANKVVSALALKSLIYERLNLAEQSIGVLRTIVKNYPGSQEALRAEMQLKEMKIQKEVSKR